MIAGQRLVQWTHVAHHGSRAHPFAPLIFSITVRVFSLRFHRSGKSPNLTPICRPITGNESDDSRDQVRHEPRYGGLLCRA